MRKVKLFDWGEEIIFANEDWFLGKILELQGEFNDTASQDFVFYVLKGTLRISFDNGTYEFNSGKTLFVREGTNFTLTSPDENIVEVLQILRNPKDSDDNFSEGSRF